MNEILNYFEDMDETVYISDIETYDLIYMNSTLRNYFDYKSHEEYCGKKCYKVIHGFDEPCPFCNNEKLKDKNWLSWIYTSPVLHKQYLVKDRIFHFEDKKYRIEVSLDINAAESIHNRQYNSIYNSMVNECLHEIISTSSAEESIEQILAYVGSRFSCERVYIFELHDKNLVSNTYEWCVEGCESQKEILQNEPIESVDWWLEAFKQNDLIFIKDVEEIKTEYPTTYAILKPQNITSLAAVAIYINNEIYGFVGVDNPSESTFHIIRPLLSAIEKVISLLLRRRELFSRLERMSFRDSLTGAFNRNAISEHFADTSKIDSIGVIYCDITKLKRTNDTLGHEAGDFMIQRCYEYIHNILKTEKIYRIGGDEFISVHCNCSQEDFNKKVEKLKESIKTYQYHIAVGAIWSNEKSFDIDKLIAEADELMYQDKRDYYSQNYMANISHNLCPIDYNIPKELVTLNSPEEFMAAISHNADVFFRSIAENNNSSYFYFGDMQKNLYYISDNLRDDFGFESNIVSNFLERWGDFIYITNFKKTYKKKLKDILKGKSNILNLRYPVRDIKGNTIWVHNYSIATLNKDNEKTSFISGRITHQNNKFVVDPVTNFPRESVLWKKLEELENSDEVYSIIGFRFNYIPEINNIHGRKFVDRMINDITTQLLEHLSDKMLFYRSEGVRCVAVVNLEYSNQKEALIYQICDIIEDSYRRMELFFPHPCSIALLEYPKDQLTMDNFIDNLEAVLKTAKNTPSKKYIKDSDISPDALRNLSNMEMTLNENVQCGMENFRVVVQPTVSSDTGKIKGGEVLLRWKYKGKDISPEVFIPMLEKSDMIHIAGRWVFEQAARTCSRIVSYYPDFYISFNVSLYQLKDKGFTNFMQEIVEKYRIDGSHLVAEITESCLDEQPEILNLFVQTCKKIGLKIALDDFGSGYSSMRMLLQYPYNIIKLDRSLLHEIATSELSQSLIRSIVYTCHQCDKQVCIEGVESHEENDIIKQTACDTIQGYYYHKPMELTKLYEIIIKSE